jgi:hypothetical protein
VAVGGDDVAGVGSEEAFEGGVVIGWFGVPYQTPQVGAFSIRCIAQE